MTGNRPSIEYINPLKERILVCDDAAFALMEKIPGVHAGLKSQYGDVLNLVPENHRLIGSTQNREITEMGRKRLRESGMSDLEIDRRIHEAGLACQMAARELLNSISL